MPELFGMPYLLPAIIVVVLLVALVMVLYARRRRQAAKPPAEMTPVERETAPTASDPTARVASSYPPSRPETRMDDESPTESDYVAREASGDAASAGAPNGQPPVGASQGRPVRTWQQDALDQGFDADPITPVLVELLHGWGEFSAADMKRLSIFRPEKVQAAVQTLELPKDLKNDRDARARLEQLALYASQLQAGTQVAEPGRPATPRPQAVTLKPDPRPPQRPRLKTGIPPRQERALAPQLWPPSLQLTPIASQASHQPPLLPLRSRLWSRCRRVSTERLIPSPRPSQTRRKRLS